MPDDLGESLFYALLGDIRGSSQGQTAQEENGAKRVLAWSGFVIPHKEPVQVIEGRILEGHGVEPCIIWRPIGERVLRANGAMFSIVESHPHSSPSLRL